MTTTGLETDLSITCSEQDGTIMVDVSGELDTYTSIRLRPVLDDCVRQRPRRITVRMADVTFVDSGGLGLLVSAQRAAHAADVAFGLSEPSSSVARLLEVTGMTERLVADA